MIISAALIILLVVIKIDTDSKKESYSLKEDSSYNNLFTSFFKDETINKAFEQDLTKDSKPEFIFITSKKSCQKDCKQKLTIFQGNKKIFEHSSKTLDITPKSGGFLLKTNISSSYIWTDKGFTPEQQQSID